MKASRAVQILPWCLTIAALLFIALRPAQAVQRVDYNSLLSADLLQTDEIQHSTQRVQVIGDRLVILLRENAPQGGYYEWQVVYRAVITFKHEATGPAKFIPKGAIRGMSPELREQIRALPGME